MASIALRHVSKRFPDGTIAVRDADFTIEDGELFVLVGPSGCGKSTLLNMIAGLEPLSDGEIHIDGRLVNNLDPKDRNIAMVFQSYALYPHMTVRENIAFPLRMAGTGRREIEQRVSRAAASLELEDLLERKPHSLSGGQRQRVAMGRAIVREPAAFLLDEPLSNLDARLRVQTRAEIARLQKRLGATMIHVTHDQIEAMTLGDRLAVIDRGEVQQIGSPRELYAAPRNLFVAGFLGAPAMNFLPAELRDGRLVLPMCDCPLPEPLYDRRGELPRQLLVGIRPEDLGEDASGNRGQPGFTATVEMLEWTGADLHAHVRIGAAPVASDRRLPGHASGRRPTGDYTIVVRLDSTARLVEGDPVDLQLDPARLHLFDANSGRNLLG